jgi:hypothetical protein
LWTGSPNFTAIGAALAIGLALMAALYLLRRDQRPAALGAIGAAAFIGQMAILGLVLPRQDELWISRQAQQLIHATTPCVDPTIASAGYGEPSLVFLLGRRTQLVGPEQAADFLLDRKGKSCALALIDAQGAAAFRARLGASKPLALGQVAGFDYTAGDRYELTLYALP